METGEVLLERALQGFSASRLGEKREEIAAFLDEATAFLLCAFDDRYDPLTCLRGARDVLVKWTSAADSSEEELIRLEAPLVDAERALALQVFRPPSPRPLLVATNERLTLHHLNRNVIVPCSSADDAAFFVPLIAQGQDGFASDPLPAFTAEGWAKSRLEDIFQDICSLATARAPQMAEPWRSASVIESRLFTLIDAALSLSGVSLSYLEGVVLGSPAPDPNHLLGLSLLGGVLSGRDGLALSERTFLELEEEDGFAEAFVEAWSVLPHAMVEPIMRLWLEGDRAGRRRVAVEILARRRTIQPFELERAVRGMDDVTAVALVPYVLSGGPHHRFYIDECLRVNDAGAGAIWYRQARLASALTVHPEAARRCARQCVEGDIEAGRLYAALGNLEDACRLLEYCRASPNEALVVALGWAGDPACIPLLISLLSWEEQGVVFQAAAALERITGANLLEWIALPPEGVMDADLGQKEGEEPLRESMSNARDPDPEPSPELIELPSCDPERWQAYVKEHHEKLVSGVKTRRGHHYTPRVALWELDQGSYSASDRRALYHELVIRSGVSLFFDERAFVKDQEAQIAEMKQRLEARGWEPGTWSLPLGTKWS